MKRFKEFIAENKEKSIHSGTSAAKISNHIVKHYEAKKIKRYGVGSNPYSDEHHLDHSIDKKHADHLHNHLVSSGWNHEHHEKTTYKNDSYHSPGHEYTHADGGRIKVTHGEGGSEVRVYGKKKAKRTTTPYYD